MDKGWTYQQLKGVIGLGTLAFFCMILTGELKSNWAIPLGIGQGLGLLLAGISDFYCYSTAYTAQLCKSGNGTICEKCKLPRQSDTYHCEICCVCVYAYSHHSYWLNTCIGAANAATYLLCLAGLSLTALCQVCAEVALMVLMLSERSFAMHISSKYSLADQGYLFNLLLPFSFLVSSSVAIASCFNFGFHLCKDLCQWRLKRKGRKVVSPEWGLVNSSSEISHLAANWHLSSELKKEPGGNAAVSFGASKTGKVKLERVIAQYCP